MRFDLEANVTIQPELCTCCKVRENTQIEPKGNPPSPTGVERKHLEWADFVTMKPKAELLQASSSICRTL